MDIDRIFYELLEITDGNVAYSLNPILVYKNIRRSYMIQPIDRVFKTIRYEKYKEVLKEVFKNINLIEIDQGIIFTYDKRLPFDKDNYTEYELGRYLSYPFPGDIDDRRNYCISLIVDNIENNKRNIQITQNCVMGFIAGDRTNEDLEYLIYRINRVLEKIGDYKIIKECKRCWC